MTHRYVMALDAGTTSIRAILFDKAGDIAAIASQEFPQIYPQPGWVEHNPLDIWNTQVTVAKQVLAQAECGAEDIAAIGVTNQRETVVIWDRATGEPIHHAIVWQDRRTAGLCEQLKARGLEEYVKRTTGLIIDAYFSGTKVKWILDNVPGARQRADRGELAFGTVDSWLIWNLTGGAAHVTDYTNASRTMLFDITRLDWDQRLLDELDIPRAILPEVRPTSEVYGHTEESVLLGARIPVASAVGDQQGALFGQACFEVGTVKATYGTGASLVLNTGEDPVFSDSGMLTTIAWGVDGGVEYALEGLIFVAAASIQWLRDELQIVYDAEDTEYAARHVPDTNGVYVVPAFVGLAAPYWDQYARGAILGLTRGASRKHVIRATLESIAYQIRDVITCMEADSGISTREIKVDGGATANNFLMQFQADILDVPVLRPTVIESSARGAAFLAGLATGFWTDRAELTGTFRLERRFDCAMDRARADRLYAGWQKAVGCARDWEEH
ncbi:glycerol kinase GlpK [Streptomyces melanosporofaciens]|uniref:Glycerol kinase n=1 Tax=Streptomyces melanosporofaciens TaxID=67327 RepID=A0A1H5A0D0_STRMJ|nr:glycerol kinase GlpK [Streptomyces melanosporofaciens]SED35717.1 glycerol kinase [Streptomyces melanosporofaciens]